MWHSCYTRTQLPTYWLVDSFYRLLLPHPLPQPMSLDKRRRRSRHRPSPLSGTTCNRAARVWSSVYKSHVVVDAICDL